MSDKKPPTFRGTKPEIDNRCAKCGTKRTAGCWRRGWSVQDGSVNLCNKCGLQYKSGKLESSSPGSDTQREDLNSPVVSHDSSLEGEPSKPLGPYVAYSVARQADVGTAKKVLFYVHDAEHNEKLALIGYDTRGTGHFNYESMEGFFPPLKCKNRKVVIAWLEDMGAVQEIEKPTEKKYLYARRASRVPPRPVFDKNYCDLREETGNDSGIDSENFYLVDSEGNERLAVCGGIHGDCSNYRCVLEEQDLSFDSRDEAVGWLEWVIGKVQAPPHRFLKKEPRKPVRTRDDYTSSLAETGAPKRRLSSVVLEDMKAVFGEQDLLKWVLRKPSIDEINTFHEWSDHLKTVVEGMRNDEDRTTEACSQVVDVLQRIQQKETCLKLLEVTSIARPISALRRHSSEEISALATEITQNWNEWTTRALEKASAAKKKSWMC